MFYALFVKWKVYKCNELNWIKFISKAFNKENYCTLQLNAVWNSQILLLNWNSEFHYNLFNWIKQTIRFLIGNGIRIKY